MSKVENLILSDWLGREYMFEVYPKRTEFNSVPGIYLFTRRSANQHGAFHEILYIGKTKSFKNRLNYNHEKWIPVGEPQEHYWFDFWDADLGQPIGEKAQLYENRDKSLRQGKEKI